MTPVPSSITVPPSSNDGWHTVTQRGRHVGRPSGFLDPDTSATQVDESYYSVFDLADESDTTVSDEDTSLNDSFRPYGLQLGMRHLHGLAHSAARHDTHLRSVAATMERISHFSDPPTPNSMLVGAAGNAFTTTTELQVIKLHETLSSEDKEAWEAAIEDEYQRFQRLNVFEARTRASVPPRSKILTSTWTMKKKANGTYRAHLNMRGYEQIHTKYTLPS